MERDELIKFIRESLEILTEDELQEVREAIVDIILAMMTEDRP